MAAGPFARLIAQLVVPVVAVLARALPAAYAQALQNAKKAGGAAAQDAAKQAPIFGKKVMSKQEALQILNLEETKVLKPEEIQKQCERFMEANDVSKGGSFYLQSKFYRANELLQEYIKEKQKETGATDGVEPPKPGEDSDEEKEEKQQQQQSK